MPLNTLDVSSVIATYDILSFTATSSYVFNDFSTTSPFDITLQTQTGTVSTIYLDGLKQGAADEVSVEYFQNNFFVPATIFTGGTVVAVPSQMSQSTTAWSYEFEATISGVTTPIAYVVVGTSAGTVQFTTSGSGLFIATVVPCFAAGTLVATEVGAKAVEDLLAGELLRTASGRLAPVRWVGQRTLVMAEQATPTAALPVCVQKHALADNVPSRDLYLSPEHALHFDGALVPVRCLVNGTTIAPRWVDSVTYFHVELDRHDIILAEGAETESWLDCGSRGQFDNALPPAQWPPCTSWEEGACATLVESGTLVESIRAALAGRAVMLGHAPHLGRPHDGAAECRVAA